MNKTELKDFLDKKVDEFNRSDFILTDPISIPKKFTKLQDIEIVGLWIAILSWGQRVTIINNGNKLIELMDNSPHDFITNHIEKDRERFSTFVHRTFQPIDAMYFLEFFQNYYKKNNSLEDAFFVESEDESIMGGLIKFREIFFASDAAPLRTKKHIASPVKNSSCKRLNMFLRWMVRDDGIVDFGLWKRLQKKDLYIPLDVHVQRVAKAFGLLNRKQSDWKAVIELTQNLRKLDSNDPVKYDFALFGLGILQYDQLG